MAKKKCVRCGSAIEPAGYCVDETCPFSDHKQDCKAGWNGHPKKDPNPTDDCRPIPCTCGGRKEGVLRETTNFIAEPAKRGVRITAKEKSVTPRSRVVKQKDWDYLAPLQDSTFDAACVMDFGIGVLQR